jgi:hypothetical protein
MFHVEHLPGSAEAQAYAPNLVFHVEHCRGGFVSLLFHEEHFEPASESIVESRLETPPSCCRTKKLGFTSTCTALRH